MIIMKDSWLYFKCVPPWSVSLNLCIENHDINLVHSGIMYGVVVCNVLDDCELDPLVKGMIRLGLCPLFLYPFYLGALVGWEKKLSRFVLIPP